MKRAEGGKKLTASARKLLSTAVAIETQQMVNLGELRPYDMAHEHGRTVYVLELNNEVWACTSCSVLFKGVKDHRTAFYVGSTSKQVDIRMEQHAAYASHEMRNTTRATQVAPHILRRDIWLEPHLASRKGTKDYLEQRIKFAAEMRALEEIVIPRIIKSHGFAVYAGRPTNPDGTWDMGTDS